MRQSRPSRKTIATVAPDSETPLVTGATGDALAAVRDEAGDVVTVGAEDDSHDDPDVSVSYDGRQTTTDAEVSVSMPAATDRVPEIGADGLDLSARLSLLGTHQALNAGIAITLAGQVIDTLDSRGDDTSDDGEDDSASDGADDGDTPDDAEDSKPDDAEDGKPDDAEDGTPDGEESMPRRSRWITTHSPVGCTTPTGRGGSSCSMTRR